MKQSNSACILLTVLVLVLAGREVQRSFFGDSDELAQDFTADELASFLSIQRGMWELPEITDENTLDFNFLIDGVDHPQARIPFDLAQLKGKKEVPFMSRHWDSGSESFIKVDLLGCQHRFELAQPGYRYRGSTLFSSAGPDGIIGGGWLDDEDGTRHEFKLGFEFIKHDWESIKELHEKQVKEGR